MQEQIDDKIHFIFIIILCSLVWLLGFLMGNHNMQQEAVDQNVAKWSVDNKMHVKLEWLNK